MRLPDWETRLHEVISEWRNRTFRWNGDCARFMAAFVIAQTGQDPLVDLRGQYRTKREALRLLAEMPMADRLDRKFARTHPAFAQRGDIAMMQDMCLGCVLGSEAMFFGENGMTMVPRADWQHVWEVGRNG